MKFFAWLEKRSQRLSYWDIGFIKWAAIIFGLFLAKLFPVLMKVNIWVYLVIAILLWLRPIYVLFWQQDSDK